MLTSRIMETPPFERYQGQESFFSGEPPLSELVGFLVVVLFGVAISLLTTLITKIGAYFGTKRAITSEYFNTAGRSVGTGLTAAVIVSQWTWAATLLQSSNVAWLYGVSGPFWYASGATIQILLFGVLAIRLKTVAPSAHTVTEIVKARWGRSAHLTFLFFCFSTNIIVTSMLLLGGAAIVEALTGMSYQLAAFLMPWSVILYTTSGGLQATFLASYFHVVVIYVVLVIMIVTVYIKFYSSDVIYDFLETVTNTTLEQCQSWYSNRQTNVTFFTPGTYACGSVPGNRGGSYLTMISSKGLMFGVINIVGNFGTVFVDQSYWQSAIAANPISVSRGYLLGGICWFAIPFALATSLGLAATALQLPITSSEAAAGLVPPAVAYELLGRNGAILILIMVFMAIVSTGSAESIAVSSLVVYDIYREYFNPQATGEQMLQISRVVVLVFCLFMGIFAIILQEMGLTLGWVYLFMGVMIGSAVIPLWNLMTWKKASGTGAVTAAWGGLFLGITGWIAAAIFQSEEISVEALGTNEAMLSGNLISILSSGAIHYIFSISSDAEEYDFSTLDQNISLVEQDFRGLSPADKDPRMLERAQRWIIRRAYALSLVLIVLWPLLSITSGIFTKGYFTFWVLVAIVWAFGAAIAITVLPIKESSHVIEKALSGMLRCLTGIELTSEAEEEHKDRHNRDHSSTTGHDPAPRRKKPRNRHSSSGSVGSSVRTPSVRKTEFSGPNVVAELDA